MAALRTDLSYAFRLMRKSPGFSALAIGSLALGIAANVVIFSIVNGVLLKPLDFPHPENLYSIEEVIPQIANLYPTLPANPRHVEELKRSVPAIAQLGLAQAQNVVLGGSTEAIRVTSMNVTPDFLATLEVKPLLGRLFAPEDAQEGRDRVVILSYGIWQSRFAGARNVIGKEVDVQGAPNIIVGVMPQSFHCPRLGPQFTDADAQLLRPLTLRLSEFGLLGDFNFGAVVRLKPNVSAKTAQEEIDTALTNFAHTFPKKATIRAELVPLRHELVKDSRRALLVLLGAVGAMLLIVCLNLSVLLLARTDLRHQEMAIRAALGAARRRLLQQSLTEALLYSLAGGALGTWLAAIGLQSFIRIIPEALLRRTDISIDIGVLLFALGLILLTTLIFGFWPAWRQSRRNPQGALAGSSRSNTATGASVRGRNSLIAVEVGLSTILLAFGGLLLHSFVQLLDVNAGFHVEHGVSAQINLPAMVYDDAKASQSFYARLLTSLESRPEINEAGLTSYMPLDGEMWMDNLVRPGNSRRSSQEPLTNVRFVSGSYFGTMGIPVLAGRTFEKPDREIKNPAIISREVAQKFWPGQDPIGQILALGDSGPLQIVGVVGDTRAAMDRVPPPVVYVPYWSPKARNMTSLIVVMRSERPSGDAVDILRRRVASIDRGVPVSKVRTFQQIVSGSVAQQRFQTMLIGAFAAAALLVAALGIFGVVASVVAARRAEIGIRMALGATGVGILRMVLWQGMIPVAAGLSAGLIGVLALGSAVRAFLYDISPSDPLTLTSVVLLLIAASALACWIPARRAARVDPMEALRYE
jgi:predicted permease